MPDDFTQLNIGTGGDYMDEVPVTYGSPPTSRKRPRVVISGTGSGTDSQVQNTPSGDSDYGLVTRPIPAIKQHPGNDLFQYSEITGVVSASETPIVSYTVPTSTVTCIVGFCASGDMDAKFLLYINGQISLVSRSTTSNPNVQSSFMTISPSAAAGDVITVNVIQTNSGLTGTFEATLLGYEVPA